MSDLTDDEWSTFETWLTAAIKHKTDADPEVVSEYIVALLKSTPDTDDAYRRCLADIPEFFAEGVDAAKVLGGIFGALKEKAFLPGAQKKQQNQKQEKQQQQQQGVGQVGRGFDPGAVPFAPGVVQHGRGGRVVQVQRKKRRYEELGGDGGAAAATGDNAHYAGGERQIKQMRRSSRERGTAQRGSMVNGRAGHAAVRGLRGTHFPPAMVNGDAGLGPAQAQQFSLDDMQKLLESFAAMTAAMGLPLPPGFPAVGSNGLSAPDTRRPCFTFQKKGFCSRGSACPYRHSMDDAASHTPQYAADGAAAALAQMTRRKGTKSHRNDAEPGTRGRKRGGHAEFSSNHAPPDASATKIVVERIPEEHLNEEGVRAFYDQFGDIGDIEIHDARKLAIIRFNSHESARKAWQSPKVVFDNRFVRVYWYRPETASTDGLENGDATEDQHMQGVELFDPEAFAKVAEERQKEHEERQRKLQDLDAQRVDIANRLKTYTDTKRELIDKLAEHDPNGLAEGEDGVGEQLTWEKKKNMEALRDRLAAIEAQAESLGLKGEEEDDFTRGVSTSSRARGYGSFRGRGTFASRTRGSRGAYHGSSQGGVMRLDNRPKSLVVSLSRDDEGAEWTAEHEEALRSFLVAGYDVDGISRHPQRKDSQVVAFKERYMAEMFAAAAAQDIPGIRHVWLAWAPKETSAVPNSITDDTNRVNAMKYDKDIEEGEVREQQQQPHTQEHTIAEEDEDFDIA